jgi:hypothetical protein
LLDDPIISFEDNDEQNELIFLAPNGRKQPKSSNNSQFADSGYVGF